MKDLYETIKKLLGEKAKSRIIILITLPIIGSFFETFGISAVVSFITIILDTNALESNEYVAWLYHTLQFKNYQTFIITIAVVLILFYVFKTVYLSAQYHFQNKVVRAAKKETAIRVFHTILNKTYEYFTNVNAAEILRIINNDIDRCMDYVMVIAQMLTEIMVIVFLLVMLLMQDFGMTIFIAGFLSVSVVIIRIITKKKASHTGEINQVYTKEKLKWLNQSVYGIKDIKISQNESFFERKFSEVYQSIIKYELQYMFWLKVPTYLIEMVVMVCVLLYIIIMLIQGKPLTELVPVMSAFALAAVRLLPACNRISSFMTQLSYRKASVDAVLKILNEKTEGKNETDHLEIELNEGIQLKDITFSYENAEDYLFKNANMDVKVGMAVGIMGPSGAGKTTIVDILLGLFKPQGGAVYADGINVEDGYKSYLSKIAYIPQSIFLTDDTVRNNVAFGVEESEIDEERVKKALEEAQLLDYINSLPEGLDTVVGEQGIRISGGQKQRIGIARALYKNPEVLVLDEATSALDNETEAAIMESISNLKGKKTMIIIAHRLSTIADCDVIYQVKDGIIEQTSLLE